MEHKPNDKSLYSNIFMFKLCRNEEAIVNLETTKNKIKNAYQGILLLLKYKAELKRE